VCESTIPLLTNHIVLPLAWNTQRMSGISGHWIRCGESFSSRFSFAVAAEALDQ